MPQDKAPAKPSTCIEGQYCRSIIYVTIYTSLISFGISSVNHFSRGMSIMFPLFDGDKCNATQTSEYMDECSRFISQDCQASFNKLSNQSKANLTNAIAFAAQTFVVGYSIKHPRGASNVSAAAGLVKLPHACEGLKVLNPSAVETWLKSGWAPRCSAMLAHRGHEHLSEMLAQNLRVMLALCGEKSIKADAASRCNFWAAMIRASPDFIIAAGCMLFILQSIHPLRHMIRQRMPSLTGRASLQWFALIVQLIIITDTFVDNVWSEDLKDGWQCSLRQPPPGYGWGKVMYARQWFHRKANPITDSSYSDIYSCIKFKDFTIEKVFTAAGLIGGTVQLFPSFVDFLSRRCLSLRIDEKQWESRGRVCFLILLIYYVFTEQFFRSIPQILDLFGFSKHCPSSSLVELLYSNQDTVLSRLPMIALKVFTKCNPLDLLQFDIILRLPVFLSTASLLQIIGEKYKDRKEETPYLAMHRFTEKEWNGDSDTDKLEMGTQTMYQELPTIES